VNLVWRACELAEGWKGIYAQVLAPAGVIEVAALGLTGCEVRFSFDGQACNSIR